MKNAQLQRVWQSMKDVPMLFVTLAVLLVLVILSEKGFEDARVCGWWPGLCSSPLSIRSSA